MISTSGDPGSDVQSFYHGKSVFVTGATGFVGKSLIQRLLQTCDIRTIYVLLRGKRDQSMAIRFAAYRSDPVFATLPDREVKLAKLVAVEGDISLPRLGLSDLDYCTLATNVQIVVHGAATIKFNEQLKRAARINVYGTQQLIELCQAMLNLDCLVHVSTFSAWWIRDKLEEKIYDLDGVDIDKFITQTDSLSAREWSKLSDAHVGHHPKYPNSYIFTKTMAEVLIKRYASSEHLKVAIVRLPFIGSSWREPFPGWFDTLQMVNAIFCAYTTGIIRFSNVPLDLAIQGLPVDVCSNGLLLAGWDIATTPDVVPFKVYNALKPFDLYYRLWDYQESAIDCAYKYPSIRQFILPTRVTRPVGEFTYTLLSTLVILFAKVADWVLVACRGRRPVLGHFFERLFSGIEAMKGNLSKYHADAEMNNLEQVHAERCNEVSKEVFYYDLTDLDIKQFTADMYMHFRRTVLNEPDENIPMAKKRIERLYRIYRLIGYGFMLLGLLLVLLLIAWYVF